MHNVIPGLCGLIQPIDSVEPHPGNPNEGDVGAMAVQLEAHGQHRALVYRKADRRILVGEHLWRAARGLGWTELAMVGVDDDHTKGKARMVGDNQVGRRSRDREDELGAILEELKGSGMLELSGFAEDDLGDILARVAEHQLAPGEESPGAPPAPTAASEDSWPSVRIKLSPADYERWTALVLADGRRESEVFADMVRLAIHDPR